MGPRSWRPSLRTTRQLARFPYMAGENFTAADISVAYALMLARRGECATLGAAEEEYMIRLTGREAFKRALETCQATKEGYIGFR
jgi:glutathione S-transferase